MNAAMRDGLRRLSVALAHLWFWCAGNSGCEHMTFWVYPRDLDTNHEALQGKRIRIGIQIENDPAGPLHESFSTSMRIVER